MTGVRPRSGRRRAPPGGRSRGGPGPRLARAPNGSRVGTDGPRWLGAASGPPGALRCRPKSSVESDDAIVAQGPGDAAPRRPGDDGRGPAPGRRRATAPLPPGAHRHGDEVHLEAHLHPHVGPADDGRPVIGIVGAGAVGTALGVALSRAGWPVGAVASRDPERRERFRSLVPGSRAFPEATAILDECHLALLAVPDDALAEIAATLHLYSGQAIVHTSGLHGAEVLAPALAAGTSAGSLPPARGLRRPRASARGPARVDRRHRGRRGAPGPPRRDGDLARRDSRPPRAGLQGRLPRGRRPRRGRPDGAPRRRRRGRRARPASTRQAPSPSTARLPRRRSPTPGPWAPLRPSPGRWSAVTSGTIEAHLAVVAEAGTRRSRSSAPSAYARSPSPSRRGLAPEAAARMRAAFTRWP